MEKGRVAVVGAGPAGIAAAVQLKKESICCTIFERDQVGGLLRYANRVENILGHHGLDGPSMCLKFKQHLTEMGVGVRNEAVRSVRMAEAGYLLNTHSDEEIFSHLIIATGTVPRRIPLEGALYSIEDASVYHGSSILVVGGGDIALDNCIRLCRYGAHPTLLYREGIRANAMLREEMDTVGIPNERGDPQGIRRVGSRFVYNGSEYDHVAVFIGREPALDLIEHLDHGEARLPCGETDLDGLYIIGDAVLGRFGQATLAAGMGLAAAMHIASR